ncbi:MAG: DUF3810 domain-containing protein [Firmicutes bacterium]|nr:DUF3810 domain-containing protein [Bacillota bacterium]
MKGCLKKIHEYVPIVPMVLYALAFVALIIHIISVNNTAFADFFNIHISSFFRALLSYATGWLPISVAETIILSIPISLAAVIIIVVPMANESTKKMWRCSFSILSVIAYLYVSFVFTFATAYWDPSLEDKLGMTDRAVSADELYETANYLIEIVNETADDVYFTSEGYSIMPYSHSELVSKLNDAYDAAADKYSFIPHLRSNVKQIVASVPMTYTHIMGVYTFFTGEANLNTNFPDYTQPYTVAHEMSHQRGIAPEDEANFMAFLVCMESDDVYIRYSGAQNLLEYVLSSLRKADSSLYSECWYSIDSRIRGEMSAYDDFYDEYSQNVAATVTSTINNTYLTLQGTEGSKSYNLVTDLAVVYFCDGFYDAEN